MNLAETQREIAAHLDCGIIPFWSERVEDAVHGGYLTNFGAGGEPLETPYKYLNTQCRLVWWFSHLVRARGLEENARLARHGVDFLIDRMWDEAAGGFVWKCARDGSCPDRGKVVYGQSFAIYALSEYTLATGDPRGLEYASRVFELLQVYCADTCNGGYLESMDRDWAAEEPGFAGGDRKTLDTHMHLMEAFTVLFLCSGSQLHRRKLVEVIDLIVRRMIDPDSGCGLNQFDLEWRSVPALALKRTWNAERFGEQPAQPVDTTSYGHNTELAWLLGRALDVAGIDSGAYAPVVRRLLDHACDHGVDWQRGGIYRDGRRDSGEAIVLEKEFWQHAEALVGFLEGYQRFGESRYLEAFMCLWRFVRDKMITPAVGEWKTLLSAEGTVLDGNIGNPWKVSYHTGRAMVECLSRLKFNEQRGVPGLTATVANKELTPSPDHR